MYVRRKSRGMPEMFCLIRYEREGLRKVGKKLFWGGWFGGWFVGWICSLWRWVDFYGVG